MPRLAALIAVLLLLAARPAVAQLAPPADGSDLRAFLLTFGPGGHSWEKFGHNAIRVASTDPARPFDAAFNWGLFDFGQPNFIGRFLRGHMLYSMAPIDTDETLALYAGDHRWVAQQELNLTPAQKRTLFRNLLVNAQPANRDYRYDYYLDNCSTRVRDALDAPGVLDGEIRRQVGDRFGRTLRFHTDRLGSASFWLYWGMHLGLGTEGEKPIDAWRAMFVPMELMRRIEDVVVDGPDGSPVPLAGPAIMLVDDDTYVEPMEPPRRLGLNLLVPLAIGLTTAGLVTAAARAARTPGGRRPLRWSAAIAASLFEAASGLAGTVLLLMWAFTDHWAANPNFNALNLSPVGLPLAVLAPLAVVRGRAGRWTVGLASLNLAVAVASVAWQLPPGFGQDDEAFVALALPVHAAVAFAAWRLCRSPARSTAGAGPVAA